MPETPTVDLFLHQISQLATNSGTQHPERRDIECRHARYGSSCLAGAETVGIDLSVSGTYHQVLNFLNGLDNVHWLQRLFAVSSCPFPEDSASGTSARRPSYLATAPGRHLLQHNGSRTSARRLTPAACLRQLIPTELGQRNSYELLRKHIYAILFTGVLVLARTSGTP